MENDHLRFSYTYIVDLLGARFRPLQNNAALHPLHDFGVLEPTVRHLAAREDLPH